MQLSSLVKRTSDDSIQHKSVRECLTNFYALYIQKLETKSTKGHESPDEMDDSWDSNLLVKEENLLHIKISDPKMEFETDLQIVSAIMELLSEAFCDIQLQVIF